MSRKPYKKMDFSRSHPGRRRRWKEMEILRIKLNPEQAVLSCCAGIGRDFLEYGAGTYCRRLVECGSGLSLTES